MSSSEPAVKVKADDVAAVFRKEIQDSVARLKAKGITPLLVGFLANGDIAAKKYAEWTAKACEADGIAFQVREVDKMELESALEIATRDASIHGIMIYYPCFGAAPSFYGGNMDDYLRDSVPIEKDVEGLCHTYRHNLYHNARFIDSERVRFAGGMTRPAEAKGSKKSLLPCTPLAIVKLLEYLKVYDETLPIGDRMKGKSVVVINRSEIVGRPLAAMMANDGADVYSVDLNGVYLMRRGKMIEVDDPQEALVRKASVVVTGVPTKDYRLKTEWVAPGAVVINVSHFKNVDEDELLKVDVKNVQKFMPAEAMRQVPGVRYVPLVGKVTVAMLERNLIRLIDNFHTPCT